MNSDAAVKVAGSGGSGILAWILTARGFVVAWLAYVLANALVRYSLSHSLATDDAPPSLLVQNFRLGYLAQHPPLWEWLLWTIQQVVGPGIESHLILRYGSIALLGIAVFRASLAVCGSVPWAASVALSIPLAFHLGWPFFEWGTHTLVLAIVCLLTLEATIRYVSSPTMAKATLLGGLAGLGFLAKYGFALFLGALVVAVLLRRDTRAALIRRETLIAPVVALIVLSPFLYWLVATNADLVAMAQDHLVDAPAPHFERVLDGLIRFANGGIQLLFPWPIILAAALWEARRREGPPTLPAGTGEWIAGMTVVVGAGATIFAILVFGFDRILVGYVLPVVIATLPYFAGLLARAAPGEIGPRRLATLAVIVLVAITAVRFAYLANSGYPEGSHRREMWPFAGLADEMRRAGLDRGTLVTAGEREGGNLRAELPDLRVVTVNHRDDLRPAVRPGHESTCRLLWNNSASIAPTERWARSADARIVAALPQIADREQRHFDIAWPPTYLGAPRVSRWTMVELDPGDLLCR